VKQNASKKGVGVWPRLGVWLLKAHDAVCELEWKTLHRKDFLAKRIESNHIEMTAQANRIVSK